MKFVVYSRAVMEQATPPINKPWSIISICEKGDFPMVHVNDQLMGRLNLKFHDIDAYKHGEPEEEERIIFDDTHAKAIWDFYDQMVAKDVAVMYVHCLMGRCRSAAVAAALSKVTLGDDERYFSNSGPHQPNMRVFRSIMEEAFGRGLLL